MKNILLFGAGRSATHLIKYLLAQLSVHGWKMTIADQNPAAIASLTDGVTAAQAVQCDILNDESRRNLIREADIVISLLPPALHIIVAQDCVAMSKDLATASYVSDEMKELHDEAVSKGIVMMNELGLDPGLDHMSAMRIIAQIEDQGGEVKRFISNCGGLVSPESDDNPWNYKISWNPHNVAMAGQGTAIFIQDREVHCIPYTKVFRNYQLCEIPGIGSLAVYYNRDSLKYLNVYNLPGIETMIRGTLRSERYCLAWSVIVNLGLTDALSHINNSVNMSYAEITQSFLRDAAGNSLKERIEHAIGYSISDEIMAMLQWLGLWDDSLTGIENARPVDVVEKLMLEKWMLRPEDKDMVIMQHQFGYTIDGSQKECVSTLVRHGSNNIYTAMSELVGLPLAIYVKNRLLHRIGSPGVHIPIDKGVYEPILSELSEMGIVFDEVWSE
jgi:saccharopine dehydrogenase-like NADP-dependent oxidoreductase